MFTHSQGWRLCWLALTLILASPGKRIPIEIAYCLVRIFTAAIKDHDYRQLREERVYFSFEFHNTVQDQEKPGQELRLGKNLEGAVSVLLSPVGHRLTHSYWKHAPFLQLTMSQAYFLLLSLGFKPVFFPGSSEKYIKPDAVHCFSEGSLHWDMHFYTGPNSSVLFIVISTCFSEDAVLTFPSALHQEVWAKATWLQSWHSRAHPVQPPSMLGYKWDHHFH